MYPNTVYTRNIVWQGIHTEILPFKFKIDVYGHKSPLETKNCDKRDYM